MGDQGARIRQLQLFLRLSLPVQCTADPRPLPRLGGVRYRARLPWDRRGSTGSRLPAIFRWPGPIHEGKGEGVHVLDRRATPEQRGCPSPHRAGRGHRTRRHHVPGFRPRPATALHEPIIADYHLRDGHRRAAPPARRSTASLEMRGAPIFNPITGAEHRVRIVQPNGFEFFEAEIGRGCRRRWARSDSSSTDTYGQFAEIHLCQSGMVRQAGDDRHRDAVQARGRRRSCGARSACAARLACHACRRRHRHGPFRHERLADARRCRRHPAAWTLSYWLIVFFMWVAMMVAMMLPSAAPMVLLYARVVRKAEATPGAAPARPPSRPSHPAISPSGVFSACLPSCFSVALERMGVMSAMMSLSPAHLVGSAPDRGRSLSVDAAQDRLPQPLPRAGCVPRRPLAPGVRGAFGAWACPRRSTASAAAPC